MHRFTDPADGGVYMYTDLETFDAHRVYACFDQPDLKATFELQVTARQGWQVISNTAPETVAQAPQAKTAFWAFPPTAVLPTYVTAVAAGPTTWCAMSTTGSRSASSAASRWPPIWTRTRSSR